MEPKNVLCSNCHSYETFLLLKGSDLCTHVTLMTDNTHGAIECSLFVKGTFTMVIIVNHKIFNVYISIAPVFYRCYILTTTGVNAGIVYLPFIITVNYVYKTTMCND